jgi:HSP90 family molecular chaperone
MKTIEERTDISLIGQFYVVFSGFLVEYRVVFTSKNNDDG